ncbi:hypothetical protein A1O3_00268 [Capronia epimyces CBS 606.96]|uniref:Xylanolytic transcriptional activator regulatory domain-containing protein n=1 Tax=Capronia epimyces CBS 606.96 TaxID=1182542 RepID=W9YGN9_9EURO|nr:uncharacterized protein A1O3_00268 [Capronia epimyces CBS 606.96]EXJ91718.1 hypothetical protein A1O3_00268 [Capronia epimyces CBS 606.96]
MYVEKTGPTTPPPLSDSTHTFELDSLLNRMDQTAIQDERATIFSQICPEGEAVSTIPPLPEMERQPSHSQSEDHTVAEEDAQLHTLHQITSGHGAHLSPTTLLSSGQGRQIIEYYGPLNSITILGDVLGSRERKRLIRIVVSGPETLSAKQRELTGLEPADIRYLTEKGAHDLPSRKVCDDLLHLFFECIYPYVPILDRVGFLEDYKRENCSTFLLQSIFANAAPYASAQLLHEAGFPDRSAAQKSFSQKAKLLFDLGCEKGQLRLLQGSLLLSSLQFSIAPDKDYRFWLHNAIRIATQMGLHRENIGGDLDPATYKLCRRIWWVLYVGIFRYCYRGVNTDGLVGTQQRDVLLSISGLENVRGIHDDEMDTTTLREDDWDHEHLPPGSEKVLPPATRLHKIYFIENCKLAVIGAQFLSLFRFSSTPVTAAAAYELAEAISHWRSSLPAELSVDMVVRWSKENVWILVLAAMSYRLECVFYREVKKQLRTVTMDGVNADTDADTNANLDWASQRLYSSVFELDTVIGRVLTHNLGQFCPASIVICTSTLLALQVEVALDPTATEPRRLVAKAHIHAGLSYLGSIGEHWPSAIWALRVFEAVASRPDLSLTNTNTTTTTTTTTHRPRPADDSNTATTASTPGPDHTRSQNDEDFVHGLPQLSQTTTGPGRLQQRMEGPGQANDWLQDLLDSELLNSSYVEGLNDGFFDLRPLI